MTEETTTLTKPQIVVATIKRNLAFKSVADEPETLNSGDAEGNFGPSMTDSSLYESIQSIEARCRRGEVQLVNDFYYDDDGSDADPVERIESLEQIDEQAEREFEALQSKLSELPTGNEEQSGDSKQSDATTLPVDNSGQVE